jgi:hypothetical protein
MGAVPIKGNTIAVIELPDLIDFRQKFPPSNLQHAGMEKEIG